MQIDGDTLEIISLPNYFGSSSMSVVVNGVSSDTTAFKIDVAPRQDPPSAFNWIGSLTDTIRVDIQNQFAEPLVLRWSESYDTLDGIYATDVSYIISMQTGTQDDLQYYKTDSLQFGLFYSTLISDIFDSHPLATSASIHLVSRPQMVLIQLGLKGKKRSSLSIVIIIYRSMNSFYLINLLCMRTILTHLILARLYAMIFRWQAMCVL